MIKSESSRSVTTDSNTPKKKKKRSQSTQRCFCLEKISEEKRERLREKRKSNYFN